MGIFTLGVQKGEYSRVDVEIGRYYGVPGAF